MTKIQGALTRNCIPDGSDDETNHAIALPAGLTLCLQSPRSIRFQSQIVSKITIAHLATEDKFKVKWAFASGENGTNIGGKRRHDVGGHYFGKE